jgi:hypothetical protein
MPTCFISETSQRIPIKFRIEVYTKRCRANLVSVPVGIIQLPFTQRSNGTYRFLRNEVIVKIVKSLVANSVEIQQGMSFVSSFSTPFYSFTLSLSYLQPILPFSR